MKKITQKSGGVSYPVPSVEKLTVLAEMGFAASEEEEDVEGGLYNDPVLGWGNDNNDFE